MRTAPFAKASVKSTRLLISARIFEDGVAGDVECGSGVGDVAAVLLQDLADV